VVILIEAAHVEPVVAPVTAYPVDDLVATTLSYWRLHSNANMAYVLPDVDGDVA